MARDVVCCPEALSELLVFVDLDIYINQTTDEFIPNQQQGGTCYANASAAVLHLAMQRIHGREGGYPDFHKLKDEMIEAYGIYGADTRKVLEEICQKYRLHSQRVWIKGAMEAIVKKRPVVARFRLTDNEWKAFSNFYKTNPMGMLTQNELDVRKCRTRFPPRTSGHAVVLTSYNSKCLTFMNSWGENWADNGFFRVQNSGVLQLEFFDVYWTLNDLTEGEKEYYHQHGSEVAAKLVDSLKGLQKAEYTCPECEQTSLVTEFNGTLSKVRCPKCLQKFSTSDINAGNILALNMYLTSLSGCTSMRKASFEWRTLGGAMGGPSPPTNFERL
jgi:ribosomal protein L37AE/L43A